MRAIGWEEVEFAPAVRSHQPLLGQPGGIMSGIVQKQEDHPLARRIVLPASTVGPSAGDPITLRPHEPLQLRHLARQHHLSFKLGMGQTRRIGGRWHAVRESGSLTQRCAK